MLRYWNLWIQCRWLMSTSVWCSLLWASAKSHGFGPKRISLVSVDGIYAKEEKKIRSVEAKQVRSNGREHWPKHKTMMTCRYWPSSLLHIEKTKCWSYCSVDGFLFIFHIFVFVDDLVWNKCNRNLYDDEISSISINFRCSICTLNLVMTGTIEHENTRLHQFCVAVH